MSVPAKSYIAAVIVLGLALAGGAPLMSQPQPQWTRFSVYLALALLASVLKVRLPGIRGTCSLNFVVYLLSIVQLTMAETVYIVCAGTIVQTVCRTRRRPQLVQVAFNVGAIVLSVVPSYALYLRWPSLPVMALAAALFYTLNTGLISVVIALTQQLPLKQVWNSCYLWTLPYYLVGAVISVSVDWSRNQVGWEASLLVLPCMYLVYRHYRLVVSRHTEEAVGSGAASGSSS